MSNVIKVLNLWKGITEDQEARLNQYIRGQLGNRVWPYSVKTTAWCAAFANAVLCELGVTHENTHTVKALKARAFLEVGITVLEPEEGDVVVLKRNNNPELGHVGFYVSDYDEDQIVVFGGNQFNPDTGKSDQVNKRVYSKDRVLGYRRFGE
jgi:uncharacterized protein (TIGR02594 family)